MVQKFPTAVSRNSESCSISEMRILEIPGTKPPCKFFRKIWVYLSRLASFLEILENAVSFASGSCHKFKPDVLVELEAAIGLRRLQRLDAIKA